MKTALLPAGGGSTRFRRMTPGVGERLMAALQVLAGLVAVAFALGLPGPASTQRTVWRLCAPAGSCSPVDVRALRLDAPIIDLRTDYVAGGDDGAPLVVSFKGMASAEVFWNGVLIGRNGVPGRTRAAESAGRFAADLFVPPALVRKGVNRVEVRLSARHLWAPVPRPIHQLDVGPYAPPAPQSQAHYVPTFVLAGLLLGEAAVNAGLWWFRRERGVALLAGLSLTLLLQAAAEAAKGLLSYPYPWQLGRLLAIAVFAGISAVLFVTYAASFAPGRRMRVWSLSLTVAAVLIAGYAWPWWDAKVIWIDRAGLFAALVFAAIGSMRGTESAKGTAAVCIAGLGLSGVPGFVDTLAYLVFMVWIGWQSVVAALHSPPAAALEAPVFAETNEAVVFVPDGGARHRIAVADIVYVRAADDYCVVHIKDGREQLATLNLSAFLKLAGARAGAGLMRIHRGHAVNRAAIVRIDHAGKHARTLMVGNGIRLPVGRTYWAAVRGWHMQDV